MSYQKFERKMKNLEPGVRYVYWTGRDLGFTRIWNQEVDRVAKFAYAVYRLGYGELFQKRNKDRPGEFDYIVVLHYRLGTRKDGNGRFQEAERVSMLEGNNGYA
jgi:hypothetical protein